MKNELIEWLARRAVKEAQQQMIMCYTDFEAFLYKKFAQLVARECLIILAAKGNYEGGAVASFNTIAETFGVEADYDDFFYNKDNNEEHSVD